MANGHFGTLSKHYFTLKEAAAYIGVHQKTFYRWTKRPRKDRPPLVKISRHCVRVPVEEFTDWLKNKTES
jgi:excisionase family DNA binding protein